MVLYEGIVENNEDEDQVGKVQIRVPFIHGGKNSKGATVSDEELPWFEPCMPWYGGYQSGSFIVPPVGSVIWCGVEEDESENGYYVYFGGSYGIGNSTTTEFGGVEVPKNKLETPKEALEDYPLTAIIFKSLSGSIIQVTKMGDIILSTDKDTSITMSESTIELSSGNNTLVINNDGVFVNNNPIS